MHRHLSIRMFLLVVLLLAGACAAPTPEPTATSAPTETPLPTETSTSLPPSATPRIIPQTFSQDPSQQAALRILHAAPETAQIDFYIEGLNLVSNLPFGDSSRQSDIVAGSYEVRVLRAGTLPDDSPLASAVVTINGKEAVLIVITGTPDSLTLLTFTEDQSPLDAGQSRISVINAIPRGPDFALQQGATPLTSVTSYGQISAPAITSAGTTTITFQQGARTLLEYPIELSERTHYTLALIGQGDDLGTYRVVAYENRVPGRASLRTINASAELGTVDVYLGTQLVAGAVGYRTISTRAEIRAENANLVVYPTGVDRAENDPIFEVQLRPDADGTQTIILAGTREDPRLITIEEDLSPTATNGARMVFIHAMPTAPRLVVESASGETLNVGELAFGQASDAIPLDVNTYSLLWKPARDPANSDSVAALDTTLQAGSNYLYIITGDPEPLLVVDTVGSAERTPEPADLLAETPTDQPRVEQTRIRFINAVTGNFALEFWVGANPLATGIAYAQGSDAIAITPGFQTLSARIPGNPAILASREGDFVFGARYTVIARGTSPEDMVLVIITDAIFTSDEGASLRLINLTLDGDFRMGLAYVLTNAVQANASNQSSPRQPNEERLSLPLDSQTLTNDVPALTASVQVSAPVGIANLYLIDTLQGLSGATVTDFALQAGTFYDVIAFKQTNALSMLAFILPYPAP